MKPTLIVALLWLLLLVLLAAVPALATPYALTVQRPPPQVQETVVPPTGVLSATLEGYTFTADLPDFRLPYMPKLDRWISDDYTENVNCADWPHSSGLDPFGFMKKWGGWTGQWMWRAFMEEYNDGLDGDVAIYVLRIPSDELHLNDTAILDNASFLTSRDLWEGFLVSEGVVSANEVSSAYNTQPSRFKRVAVTLRDTIFNGYPARLLESADENTAALSFKLDDTTVATIRVDGLDSNLKADDILNRITVTKEKKKERTIRTSQESVTLDETHLSPGVDETHLSPGPGTTPPKPRAGV